MIKILWNKIYIVIGVFLVLIGGGLLIFTLVQPDKSASYMDEARVYVYDTISHIKEEITGELPVVQYYTDGGLQQLNKAPRGSFVRMTHYTNIVGVPETWAAHNGRGGDFIVPWKIGQKFRVEGGGRDGEWIVVDVKEIPKNVTVDKMLPIRGDLILQTCFYVHKSGIKLIGAVRIEDFNHNNIWKNELGKPRDNNIINNNSQDFPVIEVQ